MRTQFVEVALDDNGSGSVIRQTAVFEPVGLGGLLYWYAVWPTHAAVFRGMKRDIARAAEAEGRRWAMVSES